MRSRGRCEAFIEGKFGPHRCGNPATDIHHLLTKGRGGDLLDRAGETYHLLHVCRECHQWSDGAKAYLSYMLIEGHVTWDKINDRPIYTGPDKYLAETYG